MYEKTLIAGWGDMDFNSHMRNTAYLDKSADVRMLFFAENGFPMAQFLARRIGPVIMKDEVEYFKEVGLLEPLRVTLSVAALADNGSRFVIRNEFFRADGTLAARVTSAGGWLDLSRRKLAQPPKELLAALRALPETEDFQVLPPLVA
ncbi:MAG: thioesterase family protein [Betaproteobacteria bacterium]|nr:thioesterase family protein [Betaproteobacteria bacterium]